MKTQNLNKMFNNIAKINGKIATVQYIKLLKFKAGYTGQDGDLLKFTIARNVKIGVNHDHATNNQQVREGHKPDYQASQPPMGKQWIAYPILLKDVKTGRIKYIKFEQWADLITYDRTWEWKGKVIDSIEKFKPQLLAASWKHYASPEPTERSNTYLTIDLDNIIYIDVNDCRYIR